MRLLIVVMIIHQASIRRLIAIFLPLLHIHGFRGLVMMLLLLLLLLLLQSTSLRRLLLHCYVIVHQYCHIYWDLMLLRGSAKC